MTDESLTKILLDEMRLLRGDMTSLRNNLHTELSDLKGQIGALQARESQQEKDIIAFWAERWGPLKSDISDIKNRLSSLEQKDVKALEDRILELEKLTAEQKSQLENVTEEDLDGRLTKLEKSEIKRLAVAAGVTLAGAGGLTGILELLLGGG